MSYFDTIYTEELPHRAKAIYMYLKDRSNRTGECWPGINTIAADLGLSRSTVKRAIRDLTQRGFLKKEPRYRENGSNSSNLYLVKKM
ncbi:MULTISPECIES: helix-turn-helix domain-containing protein [unclassified Dehalobacter]|jgi:DNA-binding MarR family transcriptional regulator|uniref:helix-turn-helix domain-containing protein n=1 Tax=unclassified Dehalobacter TaxID=2635733 RepID=UPI000E6B90BB|nr:MULTISPECIES: helix-turn-helix domain-containing protein [unclassified Dehalobacter]RJE46654.1 transcriptional regulator [Dehalobacter sp. MCB1]TCX47420.1 helix-turn-helix domain-containing protein [Dehalobacter sp. 14DCB1]TCX55633.1 helix-turn-helix domain-containing protein [Dehalobacter sp. 12DCB1]